MNFSTKIADFTKHKQQILYVRNQVFVIEQKVPVELEIDGLDENAVHVLVLDGKKPVGTGRMLSDGHIGRICVLKSYRNMGIGKLVMNIFIDTAKKKNFLKTWLGAQCSVTDFYKELGFRETGSVFDDAGIDHIKMVKKL